MENDIISCCNAEIKELKCICEKRTKELEQAEKLIHESARLGFWMEGQIDGYRDCLHLR